MDRKNQPQKNNNPINIISRTIPDIFDDSWTTADADYKETLCAKILRHYYTREIGYETVPLWIEKLNEEMALIMPKYNTLYTSLKVIKDKLFQNTDYTETYHGADDGTTSGTSKSKSDSTSDSTAAGSGTTTGSSTGNGSGDSWQTSNDTPQGGLEGIESNRYLSSAVHNKNTTDQTSTNEASNTSTQTNKSTDTTNASTESTSTAKSTNEYVRSVLGKQGGSDYWETYSKLNNDLINIDRMIIDDLEPLFIGLWE